MSHSQLDAMLLESGLAPDEVEALGTVLSPLAALRDEVAPAPSPQLQRLFGEAAPATTSFAERTSLERQGRPHRTRGTIAGVVVLALSGVGATGMSAAANTLPSSWQHQVAGFSRDHLPFDFPEPGARPQDSSGPAPDARRLSGSGDDALGHRAADSAEATRSATREELAGPSATSGRASPPSSGATGDPRTGNGSGYSLPRGEKGATHTAGGTKSSADEPSRGEHGSQDTRGDSEGPDGHSDDQTANDRPRQSERPVRGGGVGGQKSSQKGPQKGSAPGPQKGTPGGGVDQGEPGKGQSGGPDDGSGGPGGSDGRPAEQEPGDPGAGSEGEPSGKDQASGPVGDSLSQLPQALPGG